MRVNKSNQQYAPRHQPSKTPLREYALTIIQTVFWGGLCLIIAAGTYRLWLKIHDPQWMPIRNVVIVATHLHISKETLQNSVNAHLGGGFFNFDENGLRQELMNQPWVDDVSIRRVWPAQVRIHIIEQVPIARWGEDSLMNQRGEIFSPAKESFPAHLPELSGPKDSQQQVWQQYQYLNNLLAPLKLKVRQLDLSSRHSWRLVLNNGIVVEVGREEVQQRLERFIQQYPLLIANKADEVRSVDLRYPNGFAIQSDQSL